MFTTRKNGFDDAEEGCSFAGADDEDGTTYTHDNVVVMLTDAYFLFATERGAAKGAKNVELLVGGTVDDALAPSGTDSDNQYQDAQPCWDAAMQATALAEIAEQRGQAGVSVDMPYAVQRGCLLYALPEACGLYKCKTR